MNGSGYVSKFSESRDPWNGKKPRIGRLDVELTERCNNDCIHCCINLPADDSSARAREMTTDQVKDILQQAAGLGCIEVRFTGGEPLLRTDFDDLYLFTRRLGMKVLLFTNARPITRQTADLFARIPPLSPIEITVYGMSRVSYESVSRVEGSYEQFQRGLDRLRQKNVPFIVKSVVLPQNRHEMDEFEAWARTLPQMTTPPAYTIALDLRCRRGDDGRNKIIRSLRLSPQDAVTVLARDAAGYRREMAEFASRFMGPGGDILFGCGTGRNPCIDAYGKVQPCMGVRAPELTVDAAGRTSSSAEKSSENINLADALDRFARLRDRRAKNPEYLNHCGRCFLKGLCEQCPGKSWTEFGSLDTPVPYLCEVAHEQARYMGWLKHEERAWEVEDWRRRLDFANSSG